MSKPREQLITELAGNLPVTNRAGRTADLIALWLIVNITAAIVITAMAGPFRDGSLQQVLEHPQFLIESLTGLLAISLLGIAAIRSAIPAKRSKWKYFGPPLVVLLVWIGFYVVGLWAPALEPSMTGMRRFPCYIETFIYGVPSLVVGFYIIRRLWPLQGGWSGLTMGLAAGATPALIMQFACMYVPSHIITHHVLPGLLLGVIGAVAGWLILSR